MRRLFGEALTVSVALLIAPAEPAIGQTNALRPAVKNPIAKEGEESLRVAQDRLTYWRSVGATASPTVERLIKQAAAKAA